MRKYCILKNFCKQKAFRSALRKLIHSTANDVADIATSFGKDVILSNVMGEDTLHSFDTDDSNEDSSFEESSEEESEVSSGDEESTGGRSLSRSPSASSSGSLKTRRLKTTGSIKHPKGSSSSRMSRPQFGGKAPKTSTQRPTRGGRSPKYTTPRKGKGARKKTTPQDLKRAREATLRAESEAKRLRRNSPPNSSDEEVMEEVTSTRSGKPSKKKDAATAAKKLKGKALQTFNEEEFTRKMRASDVRLHQTVMFGNRKVNIPINRLRPPHESYRQRGLRQSIMDTVQPSMATAFDPHKVQIAGIIARVDGGEVDVTNLTKRGLEQTIDEYVFYCIGGNHTRQAAINLAASHPTEEKFQTMPVTVHTPMSEVMAVQIGDMHQKTTHSGQANSTLETALLYINRARIFTENPELYEEKNCFDHICVCANINNKARTPLGPNFRWYTIVGEDKVCYDLFNTIADRYMKLQLKDQKYSSCRVSRPKKLIPKAFPPTKFQMFTREIPLEQRRRLLSQLASKVISMEEL